MPTEPNENSDGKTIVIFDDEMGDEMIQVSNLTIKDSKGILYSYDSNPASAISNPEQETGPLLIINDHWFSGGSRKLKERDQITLFTANSADTYKVINGKIIDSSGKEIHSTKNYIGYQINGESRRNVNNVALNSQ